MLAQSKIYYGKRDGFEIFFDTVESGHLISPIVAAIEFDTYEVDIQSEAPLFRFQRIELEKEIWYDIFTIAAFSLDNRDRKGFHGFSIIVPCRPLDLHRANVLEYLRIGLEEANELKKESVDFEELTYVKEFPKINLRARNGRRKKLPDPVYNTKEIFIPLAESTSDSDVLEIFKCAHNYGVQDVLFSKSNVLIGGKYQSDSFYSFIDNPPLKEDWTFIQFADIVARRRMESKISQPVEDTPYPFEEEEIESKEELIDQEEHVENIKEELNVEEPPKNIKSLKRRLSKNKIYLAEKQYIKVRLPENVSLLCEITNPDKNKINIVEGERITFILPRHTGLTFLDNDDTFIENTEEDQEITLIQRRLNSRAGLNFEVGEDQVKRTSRHCEIVVKVSPKELELDQDDLQFPLDNDRYCFFIPGSELILFIPAETPVELRERIRKGGWNEALKSIWDKILQNWWVSLLIILTVTAAIFFFANQVDNDSANSKIESSIEGPNKNMEESIPEPITAYPDDEEEEPLSEEDQKLLEEAIQYRKDARAGLNRQFPGQRPIFSRTKVDNYIIKLGGMPPNQRVLTALTDLQKLNNTYFGNGYEMDKYELYRHEVERDEEGKLETLESIAKSHGVTVKQINIWNPRHTNGDGTINVEDNGELPTLVIYKKKLIK